MVSRYWHAIRQRSIAYFRLGEAFVPPLERCLPSPTEVPGLDDDLGDAIHDSPFVAPHHLQSPPPLSIPPPGRKLDQGWSHPSQMLFRHPPFPLGAKEYREKDATERILTRFLYCRLGPAILTRWRSYTDWCNRKRSVVGVFETGCRK
ncbi:hypothetical protein PAPYR_10065 [Paratrimastix pyriformis]|uniref:Uncharacterized protein n=1 Tax=Paratrimastix pyriformis TaxID=342808 RepID=A0ABQ8U6R1_9EUKA|nr:hypothetical protein PAPYR_10065 [Paratrimastix pyriformis]